MFLTYCISLNNSRPSIRFPQIISALRQKYLKWSPPPHPSRHLLLVLSPPCQVEVESDAAELISDDLSSDNEDIDIENHSRNQIWNT